MRELLDGAAGERLATADYQADFDRNFWKIDSSGFWKLERQQYFQEPGDDSWEAFARGNWEESLRLMEAVRAELDAHHHRIDEHGFTVRRVRVLEEPIIPYLQWELHLLRVREQSGSEIRVVGPEQVMPLESAGLMPEINILGTGVMYEVLYDERGILDGGRRFTDRELIQRCQRVIAGLFAAGEPLAVYFDREVASLPPPVTQHTP